MRHVLKRELLLNIKNLLIWSLSVGSMGLICILMYQSMKGEVKEMADVFSNMGAFSEAFGMSTLSIATMKGFFATEVGTVHGLGGGMFAAIISINMISKEEEGHTGEFLFSLPISRSKVLMAKAICIVIMLVVFTFVCGALYVAGVVMLKEDIPASEFVTFMLRQLLMNLEVAAICFGLSCLAGKNRMGLGLGVALMFYLYDVLGRVVPDLKDYLFIGPYSYANASEIFTDAMFPAKGILVALIVMVCSVLFAFWYYGKRDLAS